MMKRSSVLGVLAVGLVAVTGVFVLTSRQDREARVPLVAGVVPGTSGTVLTAADRDVVVETQRDNLDIADKLHYPSPIPGEISGPLPDQCTSSMIPINCRNSWIASGRKGKYYRSVSVTAGGFRRYADTGLFFIVRDNIPSLNMYFSRAFVPWAGSVEITDAPLGVEGSTHVWDAHIGFEGESGMVGYLDLADDSVHVTGGPVGGACPAGTHGTPPDCEFDQSRFGVLKVRQSKRSVRPGGRVVFKFTVPSVGAAEIRRAKICGRVPRKMVSGKRCFWIGKMPVGKVASGTLRFRVKKSVRPGREIHLSFRTWADPWPTEATDPGVRQARTTLKVRRRG